MNKILGIILIAIGAVLIVQGVNRQGSLAGHAESTGKSIANSVDGGDRTPKATVWIVGGAVVAAAGLAVAVSGFRRSS